MILEIDKEGFKKKGRKEEKKKIQNTKTENIIGKTIITTKITDIIDPPPLFFYRRE